MRALLDRLLFNEFIVDEKPLPVFLSSGEGSEDLLTLAGRVMVENDRLLDLNEKLQSMSGRPEDLERFVKGLLPTLDAFDRILSVARDFPAGEEVDNWLRSVESVYFRLAKALEGVGLVALKTVGKVVDLNLHEVVECRATKDHPHNTVISEFQKGYAFRGKLLRDAKVVVANNE